MFTIDDVKNGMLVQTRDGRYWLALRNHVCDHDDMFVSLKEYTVGEEINRYDGNLKHRYNSDLDIMKVVKANVFPRLSNPEQEFNDLNLLFDRDSIKQMTLSEVCEKLGYDIEIIKE